jgi:hypothetical protein
MRGPLLVQGVSKLRRGQEPLGDEELAEEVS